MKIAALDLGSNTFLSLIAVVENHEITKIISDEIEVVRLGENQSKTNQEKKYITDQALLRAEVALKKFKIKIDQEKPDRILAMATSAARDAENKQQLFAICHNLGIPLEIIPGYLEAQITFQGSVSNKELKLDINPLLVVDIGGGSTEFIFGQNKKILSSKSLDIGCVRLTEKEFSSYPPTLIEIENLKKTIQNGLEIIALTNPFNINSPNLQILAVAGTPTTLASVMIGQFDAKKIDGFQISLGELDVWINKLSKLTVQEIIDLGFPQGRADVILVGLIILYEILKKFEIKALTVSTRGVRHGVALEVYRRG